MDLLIGNTVTSLWQDVIKEAEKQCAITLTTDVESYLISLLMRYTRYANTANAVLATAFLEAINLREKQRIFSLQVVGDQCLLFAGFFPQAAIRKHVKVSYFVDLGRSAYANISRKDNDFYYSLAAQFVRLMDVLQSIRHTDQLPLEAFENWMELGSERALSILRTYTQAIPVK